MALVDEKHGDLDYNKFATIGRWLHAGVVWVTSGAVEIGRLDYIHRNGKELEGNGEDIKTDYAAQGQSVLMETYRRFTDPKISLRQVLVEHSHFNNDGARAHILRLLERAAQQNAVPVVNYNDAVSFEELRKMEITSLRGEGKKAVELIDNDETAAQIACLTGAKKLLILSNLDGVYRDINDKSSLITEITGTRGEVINKIDEYKANCSGASRKGANGASAKLEYIKPCIMQGIDVIIASARYDISDILSGLSPATRITTK